MLTGAELDELLDTIPVLADRELVEELRGGLTNRNLKVTGPSGAFVVRTPASDAAMLDIDREAEVENTRRAASAGVGARVVGHRPGLLVLAFLEGQVLDDEAFRDPGVMDRAAQACRMLHGGPRFVTEFDMFDRQARYLVRVTERGFALPAGYRDHLPAWERVRRALGSRSGRTVPCNNDLLAANFIDDGARTWLIDYEYSGNNIAAFELGNTATECEFTPEMLEAWVSAYHGEATAGRIARTRLGALCSEYGWSLWGFIQEATSPLDFDFHEWGMHRWEKAARTFTSDGFDALLREAAGD